MAGKLSTHVLDTYHGRPAAGVEVGLWRLEATGWVHLATATTNADGRMERPLLEPGAMAAGTYELRFQIGPYFGAKGVVTGPPPFLGEVPVRFGVADAAASHHVPLVVT